MPPLDIFPWFLRSTLSDHGPTPLGLGASCSQRNPRRACRRRVVRSLGPFLSSGFHSQPCRQPSSQPLTQFPRWQVPPAGWWLFTFRVSKSFLASLP